MFKKYISSSTFIFISLESNITISNQRDVYVCVSEIEFMFFNFIYQTPTASKIFNEAIEIFYSNYTI